jgi:hypothetical protein
MRPIFKKLRNGLDRCQAAAILLNDDAIRRPFSPSRYSIADVRQSSCERDCRSGSRRPDADRVLRRAFKCNY